jgi:hypothetical protein
LIRHDLRVPAAAKQAISHHFQRPAKTALEKLRRDECVNSSSAS